MTLSTRIKSGMMCSMLALLLLQGCANVGGPRAHPYWPKPPDAPRFIYESLIRSEMDIVRESATDVIRSQVAGSNPRTNMAFIKPYDVAARNGRILVSDTAGELVHLFDIPQGQLYRIGRGEKGKIQQPSGVAIDVKGNLYVADVKAKHVVVYNPLGHFLHTLGDSDTFSRPSDIAVSGSGDRVYVVDLGGINNDRHRVTVFDTSGNKLFSFGKHGGGPGEFHLASHIAVGPDDNVYVLDAGNFRVQVFDRDGKFIRAWGKVGVNIGDLARPRGLAIDTEGNVYITDATFGNFQVFDPTGTLLMWIGNTGLEDKPGQYALPAGIAVDDTNHVFVVDQMYTKIEVLRRLSTEESDRLAHNLPLNNRVRGPAAPLTANRVAPPGNAPTSTAPSTSAAVAATPPPEQTSEMDKSASSSVEPATSTDAPQAALPTETPPAPTQETPPSTPADAASALPPN